MARIRTIKPEFWLSESLASVSSEACLLAIGLLNMADDEGYFNANEKLITAAIFPLRELSMSVHGMLNELSNIGYIEVFSVSDGRKFGFIKNFNTHQVISRPTASKIKGLERIMDDSVNTHGVLNDDSIGKGKERKGKETALSGKPDGLASEHFNAFWSKYPPSKRKAQKSKCEKVWESRKLDQVADTIFAHLDFVDEDYRKESGRYCPAPLAYLNGEKWDGFDTPQDSGDSFFDSLVQEEDDTNPFAQVSA